MNGKAYGFPKLLLKAIGICESALDPRSYRFEPAYYDKYLKGKPEWAGRDPAIISASHGIGQIMFTTALALGLTGKSDEDIRESLYNPVVNIALMSKLMRQLVNRVITDKVVEEFIWLSPLQVSCSRYNGGSYKNPNDKGILRNQKYVDKVFREWENLKKKEKECSDE
jgi:hypothetical protein